MQGIRGKNVLITGSSMGIGRAVAIRFAQEGANIAVSATARAPTRPSRPMRRCRRLARRAASTPDPGRCLKERGCSPPGWNDDRGPGRAGHADQQRRLPDRGRLARDDQRRLRPGAGHQPARRVSVRARDDQAPAGREQARRDRQRLERPQIIPRPRFLELLGQQRAAYEPTTRWRSNTPGAASA